MPEIEIDDPSASTATALLTNSNFRGRDLDAESPRLWLYDRGHQLLQFYSDSDKLSSVFALAEGTSVAKPFSLNVGFTSTNSSGWDIGFSALASVRPRLAWLTPPSMFDYTVMPEFVCKVAEEQMSRGDYFVIAQPQYSSFWNTEWILYLNEYPQVTYTNVDLST